MQQFLQFLCKCRKVETKEGFENRLNLLIDDIIFRIMFYLYK